MKPPLPRLSPMNWAFRWGMSRSSTVTPGAFPLAWAPTAAVQRLGRWHGHCQEHGKGAQEDDEDRSASVGSSRRRSGLRPQRWRCLCQRFAQPSARAFFELSFASYTAHNLPDDGWNRAGREDLLRSANFTFPNSAHICLVEVDKGTGEVAVKKYFAVDDVGKVINPMLVDGQIVGGVAQGFGQALWENAVYDENGQLLSGSFMDYAMPRADLFPRINTSAHRNPFTAQPVGGQGRR